MHLQLGVLVNPLAHTDGPMRELGIEAGVRWPFWGRGWPAEPVWMLAVSHSLRLFDAYSAER